MIFHYVINFIFIFVNINIMYPAQKKRKTKWNSTHKQIMVEAIFIYRNNLMNTVEIRKKLDVPARTLRRYVNFSKDPDSEFYLPQTDYEIMLESIIKSTFTIYNDDNEIILDPDLLLV